MNVAKRLLARDFIEQEGYFAVNILKIEQIEWGKKFAGFFDDEIEDRFDGIQCTTTDSGCPLLPDVLGWLECKVYKQVDAGDNDMFIAEVLAGEWTDGIPLLYHNRQWGSFAPVEAK